MFIKFIVQYIGILIILVQRSPTKKHIEQFQSDPAGFEPDNKYEIRKIRGNFSKIRLACSVAFGRALPRYDKDTGPNLAGLYRDLDLCIKIIKKN